MGSKPKSDKRRRAPFTDGRATAPATMAVDAQPRAGDVGRPLSLAEYRERAAGIARPPEPTRRDPSDAAD
jgi:hypothetical protein